MPTQSAKARANRFAAAVARPLHPFVHRIAPFASTEICNDKQRDAVSTVNHANVDAPSSLRAPRRNDAVILAR
jgi:hypothetical protein